MKKRKVIIIASIVGALILIMGVFAAMFNLQNIRVEVLKNPEIIETMYGKNAEDKIIESGEFPYGSNTLFSTYKVNTQRIEKAYPFVKVQKLVRQFPDKMTIYVCGRLPEAIVKDLNKDNTYYVVDIDMKVLHTLSSVENIQNEVFKNLPVVTGTDITNFEAGDFIPITKSADAIVSIVDGIYGKDKTKSSVMSDITIDLTTEKATVILRNGELDGAVLELNGFKNLKEKVFAAYSLYLQVENDEQFPEKNKMKFIVLSNFAPNFREWVTMTYDGETVESI